MSRVLPHLSLAWIALTALPLLGGNTHSSSAPRMPLDLPSGGVGSTDDDEDAPEVISFYGNFYEGDAFFWCLDRSGSMVLESRLETLKREVTTAIDSLSHEAEFSLVAFSSNTTVWSYHPRRATAQDKLAANTWINNLHAEGLTCVGMAAIEALAIARRSHLDNRQVIVVSDGIPFCGGEDTSVEDLQNITAANYERLPIHTLFLGTEAHGRRFMQGLARANRGTFNETRWP